MDYPPQVIAGVANVLYISYDGLTDPLGASQVLPYMEGLARKGHKITVISFEKANREAAIGHAIRRKCEGAGLDWTPLRYHKRPPVLSTLYDIYRLRQAVRRLRRLREFDIVHCRSYIASMAGVWMKDFFGTKFIFDMRGFWVDERVEGKIWSLSNPVYRRAYNYFKRKEKQFLIRADAIVSLTHSAYDEMRSWNIGALPVHVIPTCVDMEFFNPARISSEGIRAQLGLNADDFVVIYLGSWGTWYETKEMLNYFEKIRAQIANSKFLIVTPDNVQQGEPYIKVVHAERNEVPALIDMANLALFFIKPSFSKKASSATKLGEFLAMGIPVVTNPGWETSRDFNNCFHAAYFSTQHPFPQSQPDSPRKQGPFATSTCHWRRVSTSTTKSILPFLLKP